MSVLGPSLYVDYEIWPRIRLWGVAYTRASRDELHLKEYVRFSVGDYHGNGDIPASGNYLETRVDASSTTTHQEVFHLALDPATTFADLRNQYLHVLDNESPQVFLQEKSRHGGVLFRWSNGEIIPLIDESLARHIAAEVSAWYSRKSDFTVPKKELSSPGVQPGPYCGMNCLFGSLQALDVPVRYEDLISPETVGTAEGSSISEIISACSAHGIDNAAVSSVTISQLQRIGGPVILHVKHSPLADRPDHYYLYLGSVGDEAIVLDPPYGLERIDFVTLASLWGGDAILIGASKGKLLLEHIRLVAVILLYLLASSMLIHLASVASPKVSTRRFGALLGVATLLIVGVGLSGVHRLSGRSLLGGTAPQAIERIHRVSMIGELSLDELMAQEADQVLLVDARPPSQYKSRHIPGAINIPYTAAHAEVLRRLLASKRTERKKIVVYCQSAGCDYADRLGLKMTELGVDNIAIFRSGISAWDTRDEE